VDVWSSDEEFHYGFVVVPSALAILWWRRTELRASIGAGHASGLILVIAALLLTFISRRTELHNLAGIAITPLLLGIGVFLWGWKAGRVLAFPCVFLVFGLGLYRGLLSSVGFALQGVTAYGAELAARTLGLDVVRDGLVLHSGAAPFQFDFVVAEACSGMNSLLSLVTLAALWIYFARGPIGARGAIVGSVLPIVILANCARVALVLVVAGRFGPYAALGFFHGASSLMLFGLAGLALVLVTRIVGCQALSFARSS
jgi:exosortase